MECSMPGFPVHHQLPEFAQTHVHWVSDTIQPSPPLSSPSLPAFNLSQHQGLFQGVVFLIRWPKYWSFSFSITFLYSKFLLASLCLFWTIFLLPREPHLVIPFSSVTQLCPTLCNPMNRSMPGLPVHHQLLGFTQTHVHWVGDAIQTSHPLSSPSPPAFNLSRHQGLF